MVNFDTTLNGHTSLLDSFGDTVLVAKDGETTRDIIFEYLFHRLPVLNIEAALNGVEALDRIAKRVPYILITNMNKLNMKEPFFFSTPFSFGKLLSLS